MLQTVTHGPIELVSEIPPDYNGYRLAGSKILSNTDEYGVIILQEYSEENFTIRFNVFRFLQKIIVRGKSVIPGLQSRVLLKSNLLHRVKGIGKIELKEGQGTLFYADDCEGTATLEKDKEYQSFDVCISAKWVEEMAEAFPVLNKFIPRSGGKKPVLLSHSPIWVSPALKDIIYQVLRCPYNAGMRRIYFESKVREYLLLFLEQSIHTELGDKLSGIEIDAVHAARDLILRNLGARYTIPEIARKVGLNDFKLKRAFKQVHHMGMFETLHSARMERGRQLLQETDKPMKEIVSMVGYDRLTSFITAFRKHFGYSPGSIRRK